MALLILGAGWLSGGPAAAQGCLANFTLHGEATPINGTCYQLTTQNVQNSKGAMWGAQTINLNQDFDFTFGVDQCGAADGVVFVLHRGGPNVDNGETGGSLGYYGGNGAFAQSLGVEMDFYQNVGAPYNDPPASHLMLALNGNPIAVQGPVVVPGLGNCGSSHTLRIVWAAAAKLLTVQLDGAPVFSYPRDLVATVFGGSSSVWFGFVGTTGGSTATQIICPSNLTAVAAPPIIVSSGPTALCPNGRVVLSVANLPAGTTYHWSPAAGLSDTTGNRITAAPAASTTYRVVATTPGGCTSTDSLLLEVLARPSVAVSGRQVICPGEAVTLTASSPAPGLAHTWTPSAGLSTPVGAAVVASPTTSTLYTVSTVGPGFCLRQDTVRVLVRPALQLAVAAVPATTPGSSTLLTASSALPTTTFAWSPAASLSAATGPSVTASPGITTTYTVTATGPGGCTAQATITAQPFLLPNVITPDGDHLNDTFRALVAQEPVRLQVFSRWGRLVYEQDNYLDGWGAGVAPGTYYYRLSTAGGQSWKGWVEVLR